MYRIDICTKKYNTKSVSEIPANLVNSMMVASISFFLAVWLMIYLSIKKLGESLIILLVLAIWYGLVYFLAQIGFWAQNPIFLPFIVFGFIALFFWLRFLYKMPYLQKLQVPIQYTGWLEYKSLG